MGRTDSAEHDHELRERITKGNRDRSKKARQGVHEQNRGWMKTTKENAEENGNA